MSDFATQQVVTNNGSRGVSHVVCDHFQRKAEAPGHQESWERLVHTVPPRSTRVRLAPMISRQRMSTVSGIKITQGRHRQLLTVPADVATHDHRCF